MKILDGLRFSFDSREDIIDELTAGRDAHSLVGFECGQCGRLHVVDMTQLLTPFSDRDRIVVPTTVELSVEHSESYELPKKYCPNDGAAMTPIRTAANAGILSLPCNADVFGAPPTDAAK